MTDSSEACPANDEPRLAARQEMVRQQIARRGLKDPQVLAAMESVPRERFVPEGYRDGAFEDLAGNDLDGEPAAFPLPPEQSGDGFAGGDFVVHFALDADDIEAAAFERRLSPMFWSMSP